MLNVHLEGRWVPGTVAVRFFQSTRCDTDASRDAIESAWARMSADPRIHLFDGPMCRLESFVVTDQVLRLNVSLTSYKVFLGTNLHGPRDLPTETLAHPIGVSPALETADGFLLFGRRNTSVAYYPGRLHPFSGALEPPASWLETTVDGTPSLASVDVFAECRRELAEELNLSTAEVPAVVLLGIVEDEEIRHPELILHARTTLTRDAVAARLDATEHDALRAVAVAREAVESALLDDAFTPVGRAALELFLKSRGAE